MQKISSKNVILHLQRLTGWNKTKIANDIFGISLSNLGNATREDRLDFYKIYEWAAKNSIPIDFNELLGDSTKSNSKIDRKLVKEKGAVSKTEQFISGLEANSLIGLASEILESKTGYADVLDASIRAFHQAIATQNRIDNLESQFYEMKEIIAALISRDRRQGERRQSHIDPEIERRSGLERRMGT